MSRKQQRHDRTYFDGVMGSLKYQVPSQYLTVKGSPTLGAILGSCKEYILQILKYEYGNDSDEIRASQTVKIVCVCAFRRKESVLELDYLTDPIDIVADLESVYEMCKSKLLKLYQSVVVGNGYGFDGVSKLQLWINTISVSPEPLSVSTHHYMCGQPVASLVKLVKLEHALDLDIPSYATPDSAAVDVRAAITEPVSIPPGGSRSIPTGICLQMPAGVKADIRSRSGLAFRSNVFAFHGLIDQDYRGEIFVLLTNGSLTGVPFTVKRGARIAQLSFSSYARVGFEVTDKLDSTFRGERGFGSSGFENAE